MFAFSEADKAKIRVQNIHSQALFVPQENASSLNKQQSAGPTEGHCYLHSN